MPRGPSLGQRVFFIGARGADGEKSVNNWCQEGDGRRLGRVRQGRARSCVLAEKKKTDGCTRAAEKNGEPEARVTAVSFLLGARLTEGKKREKVVPGKGQAVFQPRAKRTKAWVRVRKEKLHVHTSA